MWIIRTSNAVSYLLKTLSDCFSSCNTFNGVSIRLNIQGTEHCFSKKEFENRMRWKIKPIKTNFITSMEPTKVQNVMNSHKIPFKWSLLWELQFNVSDHDLFRNFSHTLHVRLVLFLFSFELIPLKSELKEKMFQCESKNCYLLSFKRCENSKICNSKHLFGIFNPIRIFWKWIKSHPQ